VHRGGGGRRAWVPCHPLHDDIYFVEAEADSTSRTFSSSSARCCYPRTTSYPTP
jgi:hypothetical protein